MNAYNFFNPIALIFFYVSGGVLVDV